jgi:hypothetical protein
VCMLGDLSSMSKISSGEWEGLEEKVGSRDQASVLPRGFKSCSGNLSSMTLAVVPVTKARNMKARFNRVENERILSCKLSLRGECQY